jgi:eukaryotic-like serine/threonine-protein kinase
LNSESSKEISKSTQTLYRFGPFALDPSERLLRQAETPVPLTPKAFDLLVLLVESAGRLLEKGVLMRQLWSDTFVEEANLSNNISLLRKALGESEQGAKYIETVPKRGYRFVAAVIELEVAKGATATNPPRTSKRQTIGRVAAAAVTLGATAVAIALWLSTSHTPSPAVVRFVVAPPPGTSLPPGGRPIAPTISPDGTRLAFHVIRGGEQFLAVRALDALQAQLVPGTEGGRFPFWKPDGQEIAFFAGGKLKSTALSGGPVKTICDAGLGFGGTWNRDGLIIFASTDHDGLFQVTAAGGTPSTLTSLQNSERYHRSPSFLADGNQFLYFAYPDAVYLGSLDGRAPKRVLTTEQMALVSGRYILYSQNGTLSAQKFDERRLALVGDRVPIGEDVVIPPPGGAGFSVSDTALAYLVRSQVRFSLMWVNRAGQHLATVGPFHFGSYGDVELSPDGTHIAVINAGERFRNSNVWVFESTGRQPSQFTFSAPNRFPVWSFDGRALVFTSARVGAPGIYEKPVGGVTPEDMVLRSTNVPTPGLPRPSDWSRGGIVYEVTVPATRSTTLWMLPNDGDRKPYPLVREDGNQRDGKISPNGRWLAYTSDQSGRSEVLVQSLSTPELKWNVSTTGGSLPRWRNDGKELFFLGTDGTLMAVAITGDDAAFHKGEPQPLFQTRLSGLPDPLRSFAVAPGGQRFLLSEPDNPDPGRSIVVASYWQAVLTP